MDNLRTEATTPNIFATNTTNINTMQTDISVNDISQEDRIAYANLNDEDLNVIAHNSGNLIVKDDDNMSIKDIWLNKMCLMWGVREVICEK